MGSESIKQEVLKTQKIYSEEFNHFGGIDGLIMLVLLLKLIPARL